MPIAQADGRRPRPGSLSGAQQALLEKLAAACPEMTSLAALIRSFASLLTPAPANQARLADWIQSARACELPYVQSLARGLDLDKQAAIAAVTLPFHNGRTEGVNTRTKMIKRQMYGRAGFTLLRHRILPALRHASSRPKVRQSRKTDRPCPRTSELSGHPSSRSVRTASSILLQVTVQCRSARSLGNG